MATPSYQQLLTGNYQDPYGLNDNPFSPPDSFSGWGNQNFPVSGGSGQNSLTAGDSPSGGGSNPFSYAGNLVGIGVGAYEFIKSQQQLNALNKIPYPNYTVSPELRTSYGQASALSNVGYTAAEKSGYQNQINQSNALSYQNALRSGGGNLSNDISAGINSGNVASQSQFALGDAQLHRENMKYAGQLAGEVQSQQNLATEGLIKQREYNQQMLSQESAAGLQSILNSSVAGIGNFAGNGGFSGLLSMAGSAAIA